MLRWFITFLIFCSAAGNLALHGQTLTARTNKTTVAEGEQFIISYTADGNMSDFRMPALKDFSVLMGPNQSQSMRIVNNSVSLSMTVSYVLVARKRGSYTIPAATANINGKKAESGTLKIEVKEGNPAQNNFPQSNNYGNNNINPQSNTYTPPNNDQRTSEQASSKDYFIRYSISKQKPYIGEQLTLSIKLYTRVDIGGPDEFSMPSLDGFWKYDAPKTQQVKRANESIDGLTYTVYTIYESFVFPQKTGSIEIQPASIRCRVLKPYASTGDPFEDLWNRGRSQEVSVTLKTQALELEVLPLPEEGKPEDFTGAIGDYSLKSEISREQLNANEAFNIKLTVTGEGNLKLMDAPRFELPEELEMLEVKSDEKIGVSSQGVSGSKEFEYPVIARVEGNTVIPPTTFNFFDPKKKEYVLLNTPEFKINVLPPRPGADEPQVSNFSQAKKEVTVNDDIRYIKSGQVHFFAPSPVFGSPLFILVLILPVLLFAVLLITKRRRDRAKADVQGTRMRLAEQTARRHLAAAAQSLSDGRSDLFYDELLRALHLYLGNKLQMATGELSHERIRELLQARQARPETVSSLLEVISACEYARYAPPSQAGGQQQALDKAKTCIDQLESELG